MPFHFVLCRWSRFFSLFSLWYRFFFHLFCVSFVVQCILRLFFMYFHLYVQKQSCHRVVFFHIYFCFVYLFARKFFFSFQQTLFIFVMLANHLGLSYNSWVKIFLITKWHSWIGREFYFIWTPFRSGINKSRNHWKIITTKSHRKTLAEKNKRMKTSNFNCEINEYGPFVQEPKKKK